MNARTLRLAAYGLTGVLVVLAGFLGYFMFTGGAQRTPGTPIGGPFALVSETGAPITQDDLKGHPSLVFFGYTYCPDVCPTALAEVTAWLNTLGPEAENLRVYFVTVDPERDTPEALKAYLSAFGPNIRGITGPGDEVRNMLTSYRVFFRKVPAEDGGERYLMDHAASFYLLDDQAELAGLVDYNATEEEAVAKIRKLIANS